MLVPQQTTSALPMALAKAFGVLVLRKDVIQVFCDGCGAAGGTSEDDYEEALAAAQAQGWVERDGLDYCVSCQRGRAPHGAPT